MTTEPSKNRRLPVGLTGGTGQAERLSLGRTIRRRRTELGRTLADVAGQAGISISLLSQIERGIVDPSLVSLRNIADALSSPVFSLLAASGPVAGVVRAGQGVRLDLPDAELTYELITPSMGGAFEITRWEIQIHGASSLFPRAHRGEESVYVLSGRLRLEVGAETIELAAGDCATYDARIPHRSVAVGDEPASGIAVISPPGF